MKYLEEKNLKIIKFWDKNKVEKSFIWKGLGLNIHFDIYISKVLPFMRNISNLFTLHIYH